MSNSTYATFLLTTHWPELLTCPCLWVGTCNPEKLDVINQEVSSRGSHILFLFSTMMIFSQKHLYNI